MAEFQRLKGALISFFSLAQLPRWRSSPSVPGIRNRVVVRVINAPFEPDRPQGLYYELGSFIPYREGATHTFAQRMEVAPNGPDNMEKRPNLCDSRNRIYLIGSASKRDML